MRIQTVEISVGQKDVPLACELLTEAALGARQLPGCLDYQHYSVPGEAGRLLIFQKWTSKDSFAAYRESDVFRGLNSSLKPLALAAPVSSSYVLEDANGN
ncbi:MAG: antibiotic biosynthesis monooxygenase [Rhizobium sp.]